MAIFRPIDSRRIGATRLLVENQEKPSTDPLKDLTSKLISVTQASQISGLTVSYIRRLLRQGTIDGVKVGHNWLTTEKAVRQYLEKEHRPGPKPKAG